MLSSRVRGEWARLPRSLSSTGPATELPTDVRPLSSPLSSGERDPSRAASKGEKPETCWN